VAKNKHTHTLFICIFTHTYTLPESREDPFSFCHPNPHALIFSLLFFSHCTLSHSHSPPTPRCLSSSITPGTSKQNKSFWRQRFISRRLTERETSLRSFFLIRSEKKHHGSILLCLFYKQQRGVTTSTHIHTKEPNLHTCLSSDLQGGILSLKGRTNPHTRTRAHTQGLSKQSQAGLHASRHFYFQWKG
jgi:hypothetical protein